VRRDQDAAALHGAREDDRRPRGVSTGYLGGDDLTHTKSTRIEISPRGGCAVPTALITGITGQDGSYLAEFLLKKGYRVYGLIRRTSLVIDERIRHIRDDVELIDGDLLDQLSLIKAIRAARPDEV